MTKTLLFLAKWTSFSKRSGQSCHFLATLATDFLAASSRSTAEVMGSPLLLRMFWASWTLVPRRWGLGGYEESLKWNWRWCPGKFPMSRNCAMPRSHEHNLIKLSFSFLGSRFSYLHIFRWQIYFFSFMVFVLFCLLFLPQIPGIKKMLPIFFLAFKKMQIMICKVLTRLWTKKN